MTHIISARHLRHRHQRFDRTGGRIVGIGADIRDNIRIEGKQFPLSVVRAFEAKTLIPAVEARD
jgi:hypothetical protein